MSHLVLPSALQAILDLLNDIQTRMTVLGTSNPIANIVAEKQIVIADDITTVVNAMMHDHSASLFRKNAKAYGQVADNKAKPAMTVAASIAQLIKAANKKDLSVVGEWGFNITNTGKITLPTDAAERVQLFEDIITKNASYAAGTSPIAQFLIDKNIDLSKLKDALVAAQTFEKKMKDTYLLAENETETRDTLMVPVMEHVTLIGNFLMEYYKGEESQLGLWGFAVHDSKKPPKEQTSKIKLLQTLTLYSLVIGGYVINAGSADVHIYKGKTTSGNPTILHPGDKWGVPKKHSVITISNPSELETAIVKALVSNNSN